MFSCRRNRSFAGLQGLSRIRSSRGEIQPEPQVVVVLAHDLPAQLLVESDSSQVVGLDAEFQDGVAGLGAEVAKIADEAGITAPVR